MQRIHDRDHSNSPSGWSIHPSLWFDSLCLIPLLAGMDFYTSRHVEDSQFWQSRFDANADNSVREALAELKDRIATEAGKPLPAFLTLWCSPTAPPASTDKPGLQVAQEELDGVINAVAQPELLPQLMRQGSAHWNIKDEELFRSIRPALGIVLGWLRDEGLATWWVDNVLGALEDRCQALAAELSAYDIVPIVERRTGIDLKTSEVEVCLLRWAAPHAIRVTGVRFLTDVRYPATIVLNNSVHELLHPSWPDGHVISSQLFDLQADTFLAEKFAQRPPEAGYNDWRGYVEEDAAQALDQWINEKLELAQDPVSRWAAADGGMHVLALLLFDLLKRGNFGDTEETFADFLSRALTDTKLWPDDLGARYAVLTAT